jgi:hypothetical protein
MKISTKNTSLTKTLLFGTIFIVIGCGEFTQNKIVSHHRTDVLCSKSFRDFFAKFNKLTACKINTCCIDVSQSKLYEAIDGSGYQDFLANYQGPVIAIGYLPDTLNCYGLVYCTAAAIYLPNLALYNKRGKFIQNVPLASGCGSDVGYKCKEVVVFDGKNQFITTRSEKQYEIDEMGDPKKKLIFESNSRIKFTVNGQQISIDTLH